MQLKPRHFRFVLEKHAQEEPNPTHVMVASGWGSPNPMRLRSLQPPRSLHFHTLLLKSFVLLSYPVPKGTPPRVVLQRVRPPSHALRAKGILIGEPRFSTPLRDAIFPCEKGKTAFSKKNPRQRPFSLSRVGKIASRRG